MDYGRRQAFRSASITKGALYLLIAEAALSLVFLMQGPDVRTTMDTWLVASDASVWHELKVWTLVTSPFLVRGDFVALLFHGLILWMFMPGLERWWGTKRFLGFALATSVTATIVGTLAGTLLPGLNMINGLEPFVYAGIVAYGVLFSRQPVKFFGVLPLTGKQLALGMLAVMVLMVVLGQRWADGAAYAAACLLAWGLTSGRFAPKLWYLQLRQKRLRRHLKVVRGDDDRDKRWMN